VAKASIIVGDPSYFDASKTRVVGKVVRSICILNHPIAGTDNAESVQINIPAKQVRHLPLLFVLPVVPGCPLSHIAVSIPYAHSSHTSCPHRLLPVNHCNR